MKAYKISCESTSKLIGPGKQNFILFFLRKKKKTSQICKIDTFAIDFVQNETYWLECINLKHFLKFLVTILCHWVFITFRHRIL